MNKPWKFILVLLGIFIAGGVTGAFVMLRAGREWVAKRPGPDQWAPNHMKRLAERLGLKPDQVEALRPIVRRNMEELSQIRSGCLTSTRAVFERMEREISEKLTPEQVVKFEQLNKEMRERARKVMPEKNNRLSAPGGPQPIEQGKPAGEPPPPAKPTGGI